MSDEKMTQDTETLELLRLQKEFVSDYASKDASVTDDQWLREKLAAALPDRSREEIRLMGDEIQSTIRLQEEKRESLNRAVNTGRSKESWFAKELLGGVTQGVSLQQSHSYLSSLDEALKNANEEMLKTIHTQSGAINQNPNLHGYIAENYHAQTFNLNEAARKGSWRAKVLVPEGTAYGKNSVDVVVSNPNKSGSTRYQSKYGETAKATEQAFKNGDYRGQQKLVPDGQESQLSSKATNVIKAPDGAGGATSNPLTYDGAKKMQEDAQKGEWKGLDYNEFQAKNLAIGIGKQAGQAALFGMAIGAGTDIVAKYFSGQKIKGEGIVGQALKTGADTGIKTAAAAALKVGVEKGVIKCIAKGTPAATLATIAYVGVENTKTLLQMADGKLSAREGFDRMGRTTVSASVGLVTVAEGAAIGAQVGLAFGPVGAAVGGVVGGAVGGMAGAHIGNKVYECAKKCCSKVVSAVKSVTRKTVDYVDRAATAVHKACTGLKLLFG